MSTITNWIALDMTVIVVAVKRETGEWCAYIKSVPGDNHEQEKQDVEKWGAKLSKSIALAIFPQYQGVPYAW